MDFGQVSSVELTFLEPSPVTSWAALARQLATLHAKISRAKSCRAANLRRLRLHLEVSCALSTAAATHGRRRAALAMALGHALDRYILLLLRDSLRVEALLRRQAVPPPFWQAWRAQAAALEDRAPSIHDLFLWQIGEHHEHPVLMRDAQ